MKHIIRWHLMVISLIAIGLWVQFFGYEFLGVKNMFDIVGFEPRYYYHSTSYGIFVLSLLGVFYIAFLLVPPWKTTSSALILAGGIMNGVEVFLTKKINDFIVFPGVGFDGTYVFHYSLGDMFMNVGMIIFLVLNFKYFKIYTIPALKHLLFRKKQ